jgi:hypothetical protein
VDDQRHEDLEEERETTIGEWIWIYFWILIKFIKREGAF